MKCNRIQALLYGYICEALTDKLYKQVAAHLEKCSICEEKCQTVRLRLGKARKQEQLPDARVSAQEILNMARKRTLWLRSIAFTMLWLLFIGIIGMGLILARYRHEHILIEQLEKAIFIYRLERGEYPQNSEQLYHTLSTVSATLIYLKSWDQRIDERGRFTDHWGQPLIYNYPGQHNPDLFDIHSFGFNGRDDDGKWDDIKNWHPAR